jgi:hypothetical protein
MRRLVLKMQMSLDGFVGRLDGDAGFIFASFDELLINWIVQDLWHRVCISWAARPMTKWRPGGPIPKSSSLRL